MFSLLTSTKFPGPAVGCLNKHKIELCSNIRDREFIMFRFYFPLFMVLLCVIFKRRLIFTRGILSTPALDVYVRLKAKGASIKIARETTNNQQNKYNSVKHV